jgi:hypothetical protein
LIFTRIFSAAIFFLIQLGAVLWPLPHSLYLHVESTSFVSLIARVLLFCVDLSTGRMQFFIRRVVYATSGGGVKKEAARSRT